jgi:uncharacterized integral membrane protein
MKVVLWIPAVVVFVLLLGFAAKNSDPVMVRFFFDAHWHVPLVLVMLLFFVAGIAMGVIGALGTLFRQRREIARLQRDFPAAETAPAVPARRSPEPAATLDEEHA